MNEERARELLSFFHVASLGDKAKELSERHGDAIELECICVSEHSPDTVKHSERISRQIFSPIHLDENGEVKPAAFDDASSQGLSVDRDSYSPLEEIHQRGELKARLDNEDEARIGKPARIYQGACVADVSDVRKLKARDVSDELSDEYAAQQLYAVYDTALADNIAHAEVCLVSAINSKQDLPKKKLAKMAAKNLIWQQFNFVAVNKK